MGVGEIITAAVAGYAAIVATVGLILQRRDKRQREMTLCEVKVGLYDTLDPVVGTTVLHGVRVNVINRSEHPVRWEGVAFHKQGGAPDEWIVPAKYLMGPTLPMPIPSRDAGDVMLDRAALEQGGMDWHEPVRAYVWLSTGEQFYSQEKVLRTRERDP